MQNKINLSAEATRVIEALQHKNGTYDYYRKTLSRIHTYVLHQSDEIGMSDTETLHTLRVLDAISSDLAALAGPAATGTTSPDTPEEIAGKVEVFTMEHVDFSSQEEEATVVKEAWIKLREARYAVFNVLDLVSDLDVEAVKKASKAIEDAMVAIGRVRLQSPVQIDEPRAMLQDVNVAWRQLNKLTDTISEAITHASNAGKKYHSVISDLNDINGDLETSAALLDAIMAIDPDNYEPKGQTNAEKAATFLERAAGTIRDGRETIIAPMSAAELAGAGAAFHKRVLELDVMLEGFIAKINKLRDYAPLLEDAADENSEKGGE